MIPQALEVNFPPPLVLCTPYIGNYDNNCHIVGNQRREYILNTNTCSYNLGLQHMRCQTAQTINPAVAASSRQECGITVCNVLIWFHTRFLTTPWEKGNETPHKVASITHAISVVVWRRDMGLHGHRDYMHGCCRYIGIGEMMEVLPRK